MLTSIADLTIPEKELQFTFIHAAGPGGQNVNKVATAVQLRFNILESITISDAVKSRLIKIAGKKVNSDGILIIEAKRFRSQEKNRLDAINRLVRLITQSLIEPKPRKKTRPSLTASAARVDEKKRRGATKRTRHYNPEEWE
jgi:ribosome-associated protein